jgi:hypothetical protein
VKRFEFPVQRTRGILTGLGVLAGLIFVFALSMAATDLYWEHGARELRVLVVAVQSSGRTRCLDVQVRLDESETARIDTCLKGTVAEGDELLVVHNSGSTWGARLSAAAPRWMASLAGAVLSALATWFAFRVRASSIWTNAKRSE